MKSGVEILLEKNDSSLRIHKVDNSDNVTLSRG